MQDLLQESAADFILFNKSKFFLNFLSKNSKIC